MRQLDIKTDARGFAGIGAFVGGFHDARSAAGDHRETSVGKRPAYLLGNT